jgi:hypothetical protein
MKVGDLVQWISPFMKGYPDETPLLVLDVNPPTTLGAENEPFVRVVSIPSGWVRTIDVSDLELVSSQDH